MSKKKFKDWLKEEIPVFLLALITVVIMKFMRYVLGIDAGEIALLILIANKVEQIWRESTNE